MSDFEPQQRPKCGRQQTQRDSLPEMPHCKNSPSKNKQNILESSQIFLYQAKKICQWGEPNLLG